MRLHKYVVTLCIIAVLIATMSMNALAWYDETHLAIAKAAGYYKWYNAAGADMAKLKAGKIESNNHYCNNGRATVVTPEMVMDQIDAYDTVQESGHIYGAIIASLRNYIEKKKQGKYAEYHIAFCAHYVGDLSMPLHNTAYDDFNKEHHAEIDGIINDEVLNNIDKIRVYPMTINSEQDLAGQIARVANLSMELGYKLEDENRLITREEAYTQISHSTSLIKAILAYSEEQMGKQRIPSE